MFALLGSLLRLLVSPAYLRDIALENLALRQQLAVFKRKCPRPRLRRTDRFFWVWLSRSWENWHQALVIVRPETVVAWHRKGFRLFWAWISRRKSGRPEAHPAIRSRRWPAFGSSPHPRGVAQAGYPHLGSNRVATAAQKTSTSFSNLEDVPRQPSEPVSFHRFLYGPDRHFSGSVRFGGLGPKI